MKAEISETGVSIYQPKIKKNTEGKLMVDGICWVKGDSLNCYDWENEDMLWILDTIPASDDDLPVDQYYCHNVLKDEGGWVVKDQVKFTLDEIDIEELI